MTKGLCKLCNNERVLIRYGVCDTCYRNKIMNVYKYFRLKKEYKDINKIENEKHRKILRMIIWYDKSFTEISKVMEVPQRTISWIANRYCYKCDVYGNPRPEEFCIKIRTK